MNIDVSTMIAEHATMYELRFVQKMTYSQIADHLGVSISTVNNRISRVKREIRKAEKRENVQKAEREAKHKKHFEKLMNDSIWKA